MLTVYCIEASSGLTDEEIKKMKDEAEANADADKKAKEEVEKLNGADALIFSTEKQLKEYGDKIPADKKGAIEEGLTKLKTAYASKNLADIEVAQNELNTAWTAASEDMYKASAEAGQQPGADAGQAGGNAGNAQGAADDVTDVDFEEVK
jgi:molecular chaperone DnaK